MTKEAFKLVLIALGVLLMLGAVMGLGTVLLPVSLLAAMAVVCVIASLAGATARRVWSMLNTLEQTVRLNLPLPRMLRAMAESGDPAGGKMIRAAEALERGESLTAALEVVPRIPLRIMRLVAAAERAGRLPEVLGRIVEQHRAALARHNPSHLFYRVYPLMLGIVYIVVGGMFMVFVVPKFETIFRDFGVQLPGVTRALLSATDSGGPLLVLLAALLFVGLIWTFASAGRWKLVSGLIEGTGGWVANRLPWVGRVRMYQALGDVLDFAADGIEAGRPIDFCLSEAMQITTNSVLHQRMQFWIEEMSRGQPIADAARAAGMPALMVGMLSTGLQTPDLAPVFRFLGRYYATRFSRAIALLEASLVPVLAIAMGSLVLWFMLSVLIPLTTLINATSPYPVGL